MARTRILAALVTIGLLSVGAAAWQPSQGAIAGAHVAPHVCAPTA